MSPVLSQRTKENTERCWVKGELCVPCARHSRETVSECLPKSARLSCIEVLPLADVTNPQLSVYASKTMLVSES